jgi:hypothetical protein
MNNAPDNEPRECHAYQIRRPPLHPTMICVKEPRAAQGDGGPLSGERRGPMTKVRFTELEEALSDTAPIPRRYEAWRS